MGQKISSPLALTLAHWKKVKEKGKGQGLDLRRGRWQTFCRVEWPTFQVSWPPEGTFNLSIILQVKHKILGGGAVSHPDQVPYIIIWEDLARNPPPWIPARMVLGTPFSDPTHAALLSPAPLAPSSSPTALVPNFPPTSSLYPVVNLGKEKQKPPAVLTDEHPLDLMGELEHPPPYAQPPPQGADGSHSPDSSTDPLPPAPAPSPIAGRLRGARPPEAPVPPTSSLFPLRAVPGVDGERMQYWPFSTSDLYNWKTHNPPFSQDPVALTGLVESILLTHQPTWDDCQQLLQILLTTEERQRVLTEARKNVPGADGAPTILPNEINAAFPLDRPNWDYNTPAGRERLRLYRQVLLAGLKAASRRPTNLAQVRTILQGREESPVSFLERLMEAYKRYTPFSPDKPEFQAMVAMTFIGQSASDIRSKLQRLEGLQNLNLQDLLKEAEKVFNKRETPEEKEDRLRKEQRDHEALRDKKRTKELSKILATVALGSRVEQGRQEPGGGRNPRLGKDQCAYCKEKGHWVRDCPKKPSKPRTKVLHIEEED